MTSAQRGLVQEVGQRADLDLFKVELHYLRGNILALLTRWIASYKLTAFEMRFAKFKMSAK